MKLAAYVYGTDAGYRLGVWEIGEGAYARWEQPSTSGGALVQELLAVSLFLFSASHWPKCPRCLFTRSPRVLELLTKPNEFPNDTQAREALQSIKRIQWKSGAVWYRLAPAPLCYEKCWPEAKNAAEDLRLSLPFLEAIETLGAGEKICGIPEG